MTSLVAGLAAFWVWRSSRLPTGPMVWVRRIAGDGHFAACPWCYGAWLALLATVAATYDDPARIPITWLAAAGVVGVLGTWLPDDSGPTGE